MTIPATDTVALVVFAGALAGAAFCDVRQYLIPDRFPLAIVLAYVLYAAGHPWQQGLWGIGTGFAMLVAGTILFATNVMGGGDTKLLAAVGLWAGPDLAATFLIATAFAGAVIGIAWLTPVRRLMPAAPIEDETGPVDPGTGFRARLRQPVPYGVAIALGGLHLAALRAFH
ncbi:MAG TPA: prepilin peptidase [Stellaceae bacterium]|nr:prepilin peptidase [Stellaceae bacterium]